MASPITMRLADGYPAATAQHWRRQALDVLRKSGAAAADAEPDAVDDLLATTTYDGVRIAALYTAEDSAPEVGWPGQAPYVRGTRLVGGWDVRQRYASPDASATRAAVVTDLENGATSLWLVLGAGGLPVDGLAEVLDGVFLDLAPIALDAGDAFEPAAAALFDIAIARGLALADLTGTLGADPLGWTARTGEAMSLDAAAALAVRCVADAPRLRAITVDATVLHEAGGADAEELGGALAAGVAYLRALTAAGLDVRTALSQLEFRYAAGADQFATIAKLRAARRLWSRVAEACGEPDAGAQRQHAVTAPAMMTARDPWVNLLRTTLACFAAGVGGADAVTVLPFDDRLGLPDGLARRLARNTQTLLLEEASVARVVDPAGGSWYVERLTDEVARSAWTWFTEIERSGGFAAALASGLIADRLAATWQRRVDNLAHRRDPITGVSEFPNLGERLPQRAAAPAARTGGLPQHRLAEPFEALRDRADAAPTRPTVFLATLGPVAAHTARATFAANLFAAGGIATVVGGPLTGSDDATAAFVASGATDACLCGTDKAYGEMAASVATALGDAGARRVWLAGRPADHDGVGGYLYTGCDAVEVLTRTLDDLEVPA
jgi:methylmalonyl-CoA mutase